MVGTGTILNVLGITAGGLLGIPIALTGLKKNKKRAAAMLAGSALCAFFAGLLFAGYKKQ